MPLSFDVFWSFRSPYSYLATHQLVAIEREYDVAINVRPVYPIAIRTPDFFKRVNPMWFPYLLNDCKRIAEMKSVPFAWPSPDPVVQDLETREIASEQPYIHRLTRLGVAATEGGNGLAFISEVSRLIFGGVMSAFSFQKDFDKVQWGRTLWLNLLRAFCAGIVWGIVMLIASFSNPPATGAPPWYALPFILPIGYLFFLPIYLISAEIFVTFIGGLGEMVVGLTTILLGLALSVGDPLVFMLHRANPTLVPTEKFKFINFSLVLYVLDPRRSETN